MALRFEERYGATRVAVVRYDSSRRSLVEEPDVRWVSPHSTIRHAVQSVFMPEGYPESVSSDYTRYQIWDTIQAACSSLSGQLATRAVLQGVGVGDAEALPLSAALTWIVRDGTGQVGRIVFAWARAHSLDADARFWRLVADVFNDVALGLEVLSPALAPWLLLPVLCLSSLLKAIVGVAGGASRAALTEHQARRNNMADVAAKDGSQETAVNFIALLAGLVLLPLLEGNPLLIWSVFFLATALHIFANYKAVSAVVMETLNEQRAAILLDHFSRHQVWLSPTQVAARERLWYSAPASVTLGCRVGDLLADRSDAARQLVAEAEELGHSRYLIGSPRPGQVSVLFRRDAGPEDHICAMFHALLLQVRALRFPFARIAARFLTLHGGEQRASTDGAAADKARAVLPRILVDLRGAGWSVHRSHLRVHQWNADW